jgi:DNA/RNA-binding protein KIN17
MPRAEVGSTKFIANQMKSKGLQRLRWYCQACERQMRDENGFKCHVASESHVRNMQLIGEDPRKAINDYSNQFQKDFVQLLRTGHGEKKINVNHFYQEYISNKQHVHMNSTRWASLTEFAKFLGREGIVRVEEDEKNEGRSGASGLMISWIDNSPEALRRQDAIRRKERQDRGDEEREQRAIMEQIRRAKQDLADEGAGSDDEVAEAPEGEGIRRKDGEKIVLDFGTKKMTEVEEPPNPPLAVAGNPPDKDHSPSDLSSANEAKTSGTNSADSAALTTIGNTSQPTQKPAIKPISISAAKPKNVFASASKKTALVGSKKPAMSAPQKPMSEAERIMKEEIERKRLREASNGGGFKRQRVT